MAEPNSLKELLELARTATPETVGDLMRQVQPAIVELALTDTEVNQVFAVFKEKTGARLTDLRSDFSTYLKANGLGGERESVGTVLVKLALENGLELWHDPEGNPWATLPLSDHAEHHPLKTRGVRRYMSHLYFQEHDNAPHAQGVQDALGTLEAKAVFEGPEHLTFVRLAEHEGAIFLDLANDRWQAVKVTAHGWSILEAEAVPVCFRRPRGMAALPTPVEGGRVDDLRGFVNLPDESWYLLLAFLVSCLSPSGPYPLLILMAEQGSGKTTLARIIKLLLDANLSPVRSAPRDERDLMIAAQNGRVLVFDNLSTVPKPLSNALCRLSTGGGFATRELYADAEETIFEATRPVVLTAIEDIATESDLLDRAVFLTLLRIDKAQRRTERELYADLEAVLPGVLGALLDAVVHGLRELPKTTVPDMPRMADFATWAAACEGGLGLEAGSILDAYRANRAGANDLVLDVSAISAPLKALLEAQQPDLEGHRRYEGSAAELLADLENYADEKTRKLKAWPASSRALSSDLRRVAPNLREADIDLEFSRSKRARTVVLTLRTVSQTTVTTVTPSPYTEKARQGHKPSGDGAGDAKGGGDANARATVTLPSPRKARAGRNGDGGDAGDAEKQERSKFAPEHVTALHKRWKAGDFSDRSALHTELGELFSVSRATATQKARLLELAGQVQT